MARQESSALNLEEVAHRTGESPEYVTEWRPLGLIGAEGQAGFSPQDVETVRLIQVCVRRGASVQTIARAEETERGFLRDYLDQLFPAGIEPTYSLAEAADRTGLDAELVRRLREINGPAPHGDTLDREDVEMLRGWKIALDAGLPEEALFQLVRVYAAALSRVAEAEARLFHFYVHERLRDSGLSGLALHQRTEAASQPMRRLIEPALLYFHRKGMATALREDMLMHLAQYSGSAQRTEAPAQLRMAIAFLDLASFTPLTESMGDIAAAEVVARFSELVREVANLHQGRVVERIGDAFMLTFAEPQAAVACLLEIQERSAGASVPSPPRRHSLWIGSLSRGRVRRREHQHHLACCGCGAAPSSSRHRGGTGRSLRATDRRFSAARQASTEGDQRRARALRGPYS